MNLYILHLRETRRILTSEYRRRFIWWKLFKNHFVKVQQYALTADDYTKTVSYVNLDLRPEFHRFPVGIT
jgi:hypothetical protein